MITSVFRNYGSLNVVHIVSYYIQLLKLRVVSLVIFTGVVGLLLAPGTLSPLTSLLAVLALAMGGGGAGALNMWYERDIDGLMLRTQTRPLPQGNIHPLTAMVFGLSLAVSSVLLMAMFVSSLAAFYLALAIFFYVIIYTIWLKRRTPQNIVIGGIGGALSPVIGWAAVTSEPSFLPWILFSIIFLWTPPHFWALALAKKAEYQKARVPMLPNVVGEEGTRKYILIYVLLLFSVSLLPTMLNHCSIIYLCCAVILGVIYITLAYRILNSGQARHYMSLFFYSLYYLFLLFGGMLLDAWLLK